MLPRTVEVTFAMLRSGEGLSFGVMYVAAALQAAGHRVSRIEADNEQELLRLLEPTKTEVLAFSVTTGLHRLYLRWAARAKEAANLWTLFGGPHPTFFPEVLDNPALDAIVIGEGERTAVELLQALRAKDGRAVAGARYRHKGEILVGPRRAPEPHPDQLPLPNRDLYYRTNRHLRRFPVKSFLASRGCPFRCSYCFNGTLLKLNSGLGKAVRFRSPEKVIQEIREVERRWPPLRLVWFLDANFAVSKPWLEELTGRLQRDVRLPYYCKIRPDQVNESLVQQLATTGCAGVGLGIECGDDVLRNTVLGRAVSREQIVQACRLLRARGIRVMSFNMVGLPGETYAQARTTLELNAEAGVDYAMTMVFQPYPRTALTDYAIREGWFDGNFDGLQDNYYSSYALREARTGDGRRLERLQRLLALGVEFPELRRRMDWLVEQPWNRIYTELFELWHRHCFHQRFYRVGS